MKKFLLASGIVFMSSLSGFAQVKDTTYWNRSLDFGLNLSQAWFNKDWTGGGVNNIAVAGFVYGNSYWVNKRHSITSIMQLELGAIKPADFGFRKNLDRIFVDNIYGLSIKGAWGAWGGINFQSQFLDGFSKGGDPTLGSRISTFLAPGYLTEAAGIIYKPVPYFEARLAPVAFRQTFSIDGGIERDFIANNAKNHYGVEFSRSIKNEFGYFFLSKFDKDIVTNVNLKLLYQHFGAYDKLGHTTNRLDAIISAKIWKFIFVNFQAVVLYNEDQLSQAPKLDAAGNPLLDATGKQIPKGTPELQISQALTVGLKYTFKNTKK